MKKFLLLFLLLTTPLIARQTQGPIYILHADIGSCKMLDESAGMLVLNNLDQTVPYINTHPVLQIGARRLSEFMNIWAAGGKLQYDNEPPNAHLLYYNPSTDSYMDSIVELVDSSSNKDISSITFKVHFFQENPDIPEHLGEVTLFIDCYPFCI